MSSCGLARLIRDQGSYQTRLFVGTSWDVTVRYIEQEIVWLKSLSGYTTPILLILCNLITAFDKYTYVYILIIQRLLVIEFIYVVCDQVPPVTWYLLFISRYRFTWRSGAHCSGYYTLLCEFIPLHTLSWMKDWYCGINYALSSSTETCRLWILQCPDSFWLREFLLPRTPTSLFILIKLSSTMTAHVTLDAAQSTCWIHAFLANALCVIDCIPRYLYGPRDRSLDFSHTLVLMTLKRTVIFCSWKYHSIA